MSKWPRHLASYHKVTGLSTRVNLIFFSAMFVPVPFCEFLRIWSSFLSRLLCSKYLQSNFDVPGSLRSLSTGLTSTVLVLQ